MKRNITTIILFLSLIGFFALDVQAQDTGRPQRRDNPSSRPSSSSRSSSSSRAEVKKDSVRVDSIPSIYGWKISPRLGERTIVTRDTSFLDFHQSTLVDGKDIAVGYLGNVGSPAQSKIFFSRPETSRYIFLDAFDYWYQKPEDKIFLNSKIPYSNVFYQTAGGDEDGEQHLKTELSSNFGKKLNVGVDFDYLYARGSYTSLYNKHFTYGVYASYIGDRYRMHAYFNNNYFNNSENGGLANSADGSVTWDKYITNPDEAKKASNDAFSGNSKDIPVNTKRTWNRLQGRRIYITNKYDLGDDEELVWINDSTQVTRKKENYVPLASVIFTTNYTDQRRRISSRDTELDNLFDFYDDGQLVDYTKYSQELNDFMSYYSFKNTLAFAMNEGFRKWTKFGLTAFMEYDLRKYSMPKFEGEQDNFPGLQKHYSDDALNIGGVLSKEQGRYLKYKVLAEKNLRDADYRLEGELTTMFYLKEKAMSVKAKGYIKNISPSFFQEHFASKYINWNKNLSDINRVYVGGEIDIPFVNLKLSGGVENIKNYVHYDRTSIAQQSDKSVQVISLQLDHKLKVGILHWDNQLVYQKTSQADILPLPDFSVYSNIYLQTKISKVLGVQLGVDAHYHTEYYAPGYDFLTMQFFNQKEYKIGNFPVATAYLNLNLKNTRFFIMYYNFAQNMGNANSFSLYKYAINPATIKMGLSWKFNN